MELTTDAVDPRVVDDKLGTKSLINLGNLSKPADTLVKKVSNAVGGLFAPYQVKRMAKAEAEAAMIKAQSEIEVTDLHRRAVHRWIEEEAQRQKNMEGITAKALPQLDETADPDSVENDWIVNFFDKSRIVSDNEMQDLWSRVLAGEANTPGTYSKRTVNFLSDLDKTDAELFAKLCGYGWMIGHVVPLVFDFEAEIYNKHEIYFDSVSHLESIGLVQLNSTGFLRQHLPRKFFVHYYGDPITLEMPEDADNQLEIGNVLLTKIGQELAPICDSSPVEGFPDYVKEQWQQYLTKPESG